MTLKINVNDDAIYLRVRAGEIDNTKRVRTGENHDMDATGGLIGAEVINASKRFGDLRKLTIDMVIAELNLAEPSAA